MEFKQLLAVASIILGAIGQKPDPEKIIHAASEGPGFEATRRWT
jgi:hypothetical protein